jgi:hypothetical protein
VEARKGGAPSRPSPLMTSGVFQGDYAGSKQDYADFLERTWLDYARRIWKASPNVGFQEPREKGHYRLLCQSYQVKAFREGAKLGHRLG